MTEIRSASRVHREEWTSSGVPFYRSSDVMSALNGTQNEKVYISNELYEKLSAVSGKLAKGDVLVTGGGSVGNPYIVPNDEPLYTKDADLLWIKNNGSMDPMFVYEFFFSPVFREYLGSVSHVGTIAHYTISQLSETPIGLPSIEEQRRIGAFLELIDKTITLHQCKLYQDHSYLFTVKITSDSTCFAATWEQRKLGDMATFSKGKGYSKSDLCDDGSPIILYGRLYTKYETVISEVDSFVEAKDGSVYSVGGEVIVPASGETAEEISIASVVAKSGVLLGGDLNIIPPSDSLDPAFLAISITYGNPHNEMAKLAQGKTVVHLHNDDLKKIDLLFPSLKEQRRIRDVFNNIDYIITLHQRNVLQHFYNHFGFI